MASDEITQVAEDETSSTEENVENIQHPGALFQVSFSEQIHLSEVARAKRDRTCRDKKLVALSEEVHMLSNHRRSGLLKGHELLENAVRLRKAEENYRDFLATWQCQIERPYRDALFNYRSWQESQGQQTELAVKSVEEPTPSATIPSAKKSMPLVVVTPSANQKECSKEELIRVENARIACAKLQATVGFVDADQSDIAHAFWWQTAGLLPPEASETEPKPDIDWTKCVPGILNLAEPGLREFYKKRRNQTLAQVSGQTVDDPATGCDESDSGYGESKPETPVRELPTYF